MSVTIYWTRIAQTKGLNALPSGTGIGLEVETLGDVV